MVLKNVQCRGICLRKERCLFTGREKWDWYCFMHKKQRTGKGYYGRK